MQLKHINLKLTFLFFMLNEGAEVGVIVTEGVIEMLFEFRPCNIGLRDDPPVVRVAPPGSDWRGNGNIDVDGSSDACLERLN